MSDQPLRYALRAACFLLDSATRQPSTLDLIHFRAEAARLRIIADQPSTDDRIATLTAERDAARAEVLRLDQALTAVRVALGAAGIPDVEPYPDEPVDDRARSLRAGGRVIAMQDRIGRLTAERDAAVRERDEARATCNGSCEIALARRQVGPDADVPGSDREYAELWEREAARLNAERISSDREMAAVSDAVGLNWRAPLTDLCDAADEWARSWREMNAERLKRIEAERERDDARRSGLTLTAEERAALEYAGKRCRVGFDRDYPEVVAYVATIDRLLAGARTVTVEQVREWAECNVNASGWDELEHALVAFLADLGIKVRP